MRSFLSDVARPHYLLIGWILVALGCNSPNDEVNQAVEAMASDSVNLFLQLQKTHDRAEKSKLIANADICGKHYQNLLKLEEKHRGTRAGLAVVTELLTRTMNSLPERMTPCSREARASARNQILQYLKCPELDDSLNRLVEEGGYSSEDRATLLAILEHPDARPETKNLARFLLAIAVFHDEREQQFYRMLLDEIQQGRTSTFPGEIDLLTKLLQEYPSAESIEDDVAKSIEELKQIERDDLQVIKVNTSYPGKFSSIGVTSSIIQIPLRHQVRRYLLTAEHLRAGKTAPEMELTVTDGSTCSLSQQIGKPVLIHFSAPAEYGYSCDETIAHLVGEYGNQLAILTIVNHQKHLPVLPPGVAAQLEWKFVVDRLESPFSDWFIYFRPAVFLIDSKGIVAEANPSNKQLISAVEKLLPRADGTPE